MEVITCRSCGKLFNHISGERICPACQRKLEVKFNEVRVFVRENPDADIKTISEEKDVSVRQIKQWIREERLIFSKDSPVGLPCESCGKMIKTGRYCDMCKSKLQNNLRDAAGMNKGVLVTPPPKKSGPSKMRFLDN